MWWRNWLSAGSAVVAILVLSSRLSVAGTAEVNCCTGITSICFVSIGFGLSWSTRLRASATELSVPLMYSYWISYLASLSSSLWSLWTGRGDAFLPNRFQVCDLFELELARHKHSYVVSPWRILLLVTLFRCWNSVPQLGWEFWKHRLLVFLFVAVLHPALSWRHPFEWHAQRSGWNTWVLGFGWAPLWWHHRPPGWWSPNSIAHLLEIEFWAIRQLGWILFQIIGHALETLKTLASVYGHHLFVINLHAYWCQSLSEEFALRCLKLQFLWIELDSVHPCRFKQPE